MINQAPPNEKVAQYLERIEELYKRIQDEWLPSIDPDAEVTRSGEIALNEELSGPYEAPTLEIRRKSGTNIRFCPKACYVIAASGRLDVASDLGREMIVYLEGDPAIVTTISAAGRTEPPSVRRLRQQTGNGWAWVRDMKLGDMPALDREAFERLLEVLSE